ncbi:hypothetical protein FAZ69_26970 [Trinickia terrae]|uniref:Uncharacterized protein n=1 Tax=Trinickia terrae TaxID=2571161 RepID=A0A4U1HQ24_9BURK|nr:hypothetical protein [Trinickia terrae]TKC81614.1 hypothetical protein FAZ69_26970 [Trinickia terrae]
MGHEGLALAAYLAARILDCRPIGAADVARLKAADASLSEARRHLPHGRGNVGEDLARTEGESRWRADAARSFVPKLDRMRGTSEIDYRGRAINQAASALAFGAGRCGEFSAVSGVLHTGRLGPGEELHIVANRSHQWAEARIGATDRKRAVVLDAWAQGAPVFADDSRFANRNAESLRSYVPIAVNNPDVEGRQARKEAGEATSLVKQQLGEAGLRRQVAAAARITARAVAWFDDLAGLTERSAPHVLSTEFVRRVKASMCSDPLSAEVAAARAAQQLGRPIEAQRADVQAILEVLSSLPA